MSENLLLGIIKNELLDIVGYEDVTVREAEPYSIQSWTFVWSRRCGLIGDRRCKSRILLYFRNRPQKFHVFINWPPATGFRLLPAAAGTGNQGEWFPFTAVLSSI